MPSLIGMGESLETLEGARMTGPLTSSASFSGKESGIAEGQREGVVPAGKPSGPVQSALDPESGPHPDSAFHSLFLPFGKFGDRKRVKGREILEPASLPVR